MSTTPRSPGARDGATATPAAVLRSVDRASAEVRRGGTVAVAGADGPVALVQAAEASSPAAFERLRAASGRTPLLALTWRRAAVAGLIGQMRREPPARAILVDLGPGLTDALVHALIDPLDAGPAPSLPTGGRTVTPVEPETAAGAAVALAKLARLLPAALVAPLDVADAPSWAAERDIWLVQALDVVRYERTAARSLRQVGEARVPLAGAEDCRILAFRPEDGGVEHLAIIIGTPDPTRPVLTRMHSECFTGDLLGSLRCDCGDQLRGAIAAIGEEGAGVLLYLAQEGRGIGLVNKLRAYAIQDEGFDTLDANGQLGFDDDERLYRPASEMLRQLGFGQVRLMTNNPLKVEALKRHGVQVAERVPHAFPSNPHNRLYLNTKATRGGHLF